MKLEVRELSCGYEASSPILKNVSFSVNSGEICCILGPNGVGKSTLFKSILKLIKPLSGKVFINDEDISGWNPKKMSQIMAYVSQSHTPPFPYLVKEIVMIGRMGKIGMLGQPSKKDYELVDKIIEEMKIGHLKNKVYTEISGGERQLLMIAKALAQEPQILILDEPTANLDYGNMIHVIETIRDLADNGICVIFTTHLPEQAFMCNAKTALLIRNEPVIFGDAVTTITEKNLNRAYQADIKILEVFDHEGEALRICSPRFRKGQGGRS